MNIIYDSIAYDPVKLGSSKREEDANGYLHVYDCVLTGAEVADYLGKEIAGYQKLGLASDGIYGIYRPAEELEKAADSFNGLPLTDNHVVISPDRPNKDKWLGATGTSCRFEDNKLHNIVSIWTQRGKDYIAKADKGLGGKKDLSCGYAYDLVPEEGEFNGKHYNFKMVNLRGNHLALVEEGRNPDAMIADSNINIEGKKVKKTLTQILLGVFAGDAKKKTTSVDALKELLAMDSADFAGGADEQIKSIKDIFDNLANDEKGRLEAFDEEEEIDEEEKEKAKEMAKKQVNDKTAKDVEPLEKTVKAEEKEKEEMMDEEEEELKKEKAMDSAIRVRDKIVLLCDSIAPLSRTFIADSSTDEIINATLRKFNLNTNRSTEAKVAMLETLVATKKPQRIAADVKPTVDSSYVSMLPRKGV